MTEPLDTAPPAVTLRHVTKAFAETRAVDDIDLDLGQGEFFALLGPSGCGKTTTLRMVGGFELPTEGRILLGGQDVTMLPPYKRDVNTVFQSYALFPHMTVADNVAFGLRRKGVASADITRRSERMLDLVGLAGFAKRRPHQLSGGQQQRVALARALVNEPKVLLLDEPMGALDAKIRKSMQIELKKIQQEVGITFLYVTHDQNEAMSMADRLAVMNGGRIEDIGAPQRVYDRPVTQFVAEFLGSCNILPVQYDAAGVLHLPDGSPVLVATDDDYHAITASDARVGLRPEKLVVTRGDNVDGGVNSIRGVVRTATYLGASTDYEIETSWGGVLKAFAQNLADEHRAQPGERVTVTWSAGHGFILPSVAESSGEAAPVTETARTVAA
ncbi:spermidine/putrescine ABC transporter ATP-binding protein [Microbacterium mangrovi]|uniref:Spermidine/putrescine import ATP-binding protein PotA n=1 Tax=Microbacterium mangrovi TaxID=1348253 RepID=A0A0B2A4K4_9MICO|nr:ABC transporter ATP-binding protein [Microbacterium mangrovi]KHK97985.1 spermidine/putrescine ABC transporter ATP-binding protein [Microbacterium mangrovi]